MVITSALVLFLTLMRLLVPFHRVTVSCGLPLCGAKTETRWKVLDERLKAFSVIKLLEKKKSRFFLWQILR